MNLETMFIRLVFVKTFLLLLIIVWGGYVNYYSSASDTENSMIEIGGTLFSLFSIVYLYTTYCLYRFKYLGKLLFLPLVFTFIILGFLTEFFNPAQFSEDLFYLVIFYVISPLFFVGQGAVLSLIYCTTLKEKFSSKNKTDDSYLPK